MKDLPKVPTWRLLGRKASTLPMRYHVQPVPVNVPVQLVNFIPCKNCILVMLRCAKTISHLLFVLYTGFLSVSLLASTWHSLFANHVESLPFCSPSMVTSCNSAKELSSLRSASTGRYVVSGTHCVFSRYSITVEGPL